MCYIACIILTSKGLECASNGVEPNRSWFVVAFPLRRGIDAFGGGATTIRCDEKKNHLFNFQHSFFAQTTFVYDSR